MEEQVAVVGVLIYLAFCFVFTAIPAIVAHVRGTGKAGICFLLTFIPLVGWFVALYKALTYESAADKAVREAAERTAKNAEEFRHAQLLAAVSNK